LYQLQIWCASSTWPVTQVISFEGRLTLNFLVSARVEYDVSEGQILKLKEKYLLVPQMKAFDERFPDQLKL
jgi:hypothetical protein